MDELPQAAVTKGMVGTVVVLKKLGRFSSHAGVESFDGLICQHG
jgi:hypothetical protein